MAHVGKVDPFAERRCSDDDADRFGIHDMHCAMHRCADNGYVLVKGVKYPRSGG